MNHLSLQPATMADLPLIASFIAQAIQHLKDQGIDQWQDGYPNAQGIAQDIIAHKGYLAVLAQDATQAVGYLCIDFDGEPAYDVITNGQWHTGAPYAVVHRFTIGDAHKGNGLANDVLALVDDFCKAHNMPNFRIDTHPQNVKMQHVLKKHGFALCGTVFYPSGERLAYDKTIALV